MINFFCICFGQLIFRQSLRDVVATLDALGNRRYHMGIKLSVALSTFADVNATRPWQIYHHLAMVLAKQALRLRGEDQDLEPIITSVYALDSTTIDLSLSLFPWAKFPKHKGAVKLHTLMDLEGSTPTFIHISKGRTHDVKILDIISILAGSIYIIDRAYLDFARLYNLHQAVGQFVVRAKKNLQFYRKSSIPVD